MSKKKRNRNKKKKQKRVLSSNLRRKKSKLTKPERKQYHSLKRLWLAIKRLWRVLVAISILATLIGFVFVIRPILSIEPGEPVVPWNPFYTPFILRNDGFLPIRDIDFNCYFRDVSTEGPVDINFKTFSMSIANTSIPSLSSGESTSIEFDRIFSSNIRFKEADIEVMVTYRYYILPFDLHKSQRFKTIIKYGKVLHWTPVATSK